MEHAWGDHAHEGARVCVPEGRSEHALLEERVECLPHGDCGVEYDHL